MPARKTITLQRTDDSVADISITPAAELNAAVDASSAPLNDAGIPEVTEKYQRLQDNHTYAQRNWMSGKGPADIEQLTGTAARVFGVFFSTRNASDAIDILDADQLDSANVPAVTIVQNMTGPSGKFIPLHGVRCFAGLRIRPHATLTGDLKVTVIYQLTL